MATSSLLAFAEQQATRARIVALLASFLVIMMTGGRESCCCVERGAYVLLLRRILLFEGSLFVRPVLPPADQFPTCKLRSFVQSKSRDQNVLELLLYFLGSPTKISLRTCLGLRLKLLPLYMP